VGEERHTQPLTLTRIEEGIHAYFAEQKRLGKNTVDDTPAIIRFLKTHRTVEVTKRLKKQTVVVPPLPPAAGPAAILQESSIYEAHAGMKRMLVSTPLLV
jgi:hypothetical protein